MFIVYIINIKIILSLNIVEIIAFDILINMSILSLSIHIREIQKNKHKEKELFLLLQHNFITYITT